MSKIVRQLTVKDVEIYKIVSKYAAIPYGALKYFCKCNKRNLDRLCENEKIEIHEGVITTTNFQGSISNISKVFDIVIKLMVEGVISSELQDIHRMSLPFYLLVKVPNKEEYYSVGIINAGKEIVGCKLISNEAQKNVLLIVEDKANKQLINENISTNEVKKIVIYKGE